MFFCNMVGGDGVGEFARNGRFAFVNNHVAPVENATFERGTKKLFVEQGGESPLFLKGIRGVGSAPYNEKINKNLTMADVSDTDENPVLVCLCREISVYDGIPADMKIMAVSEELALVMLISGKIDIDGRTLVRCIDSPAVEKDKKTFKAKDFISFGNFVYEESGYNFFWDAIHHVRVNFSKRNESIGYMNIRKDCEMLTEEGLTYARAMAQLKKQRAEERRRKKEQEEAERKRKLQEAEDAKRKAKEKEEARKRQSDAQAFLHDMFGM